MECGRAALERIAHGERVRHIERSHLERVAYVRRQVVEMTTIVARVIAHDRAHSCALADQSLAQVAADEAAGARDDDAFLSPIHSRSPRYRRVGARHYPRVTVQ